MTRPVKEYFTLVIGFLTHVARTRRLRRRLLFGLAIFLIVLFATGGWFVYRETEGVAAKRFARFLPYPAAWVGGRIVWANEIFSQEEYTQVYGQRTNQVIPDSREIRSSVLDHLIEVRLVEKEAARHRISVEQKEIEAAFETIAQQNGGFEQIRSTLQELYGMSERAFKNLMSDQLLIDKFKREVLVTVSVRHILVKDQNKANELAKKVREGADFAATAKEFSEDTGSRDAGGSLGFINRGATVKPFEDAAFGLEVGKISDPVQSEFGWHIILVEERKGTIDKSYADWLGEAKANTRIIKFLTQ